MSYQQHQAQAAVIVAGIAIVTLSDTRTEADDTSGQSIRKSVEHAGHIVARYQLIRDEPAELRVVLEALLADASVDVILTNGGTGISRRDQTIDVIERVIDKPLPGYGELFRMLSWEQIGSGAMLSRACGGVARGKLLFAMPGSTKAVELAMSRLILPELKHLLKELRK
ncbi:MogA/MoaB family molybdenum cofactor biosynthesis protein [Humisphaera borealis]|uniref:Molybdenum cofactor biosynthesis protein B n=1 Tax=Humisphaera borealis TaxID=2807512 RepID=A0A7M2WVK6_9BACT|nr:MogA/MoaB family molybdenum cofactor biosynthesis protein [Humisphaera borealis]QOV89587.1 MogA/MoaB family molybdenum cofactor biosynthesis protein [Humisphaera borealis]